jgi:hypothetical protein
MSERVMVAPVNRGALVVDMLDFLKAKVQADLEQGAHNPLLGEVRPQEELHMKTIVAVSSLVLVCFATPCAAQDAIRYVSRAPAGHPGYVLWSDFTFANYCRGEAARLAQIPSLKPLRSCEVDGQIRRTLEPGVKVERLDSTECRDMVQIRVLDGPMKDQVGCTTGSALTSVKP